MNTKAVDTVREYLKKFPKLSSRGMAKIIMRDCPGLYGSYDGALQGVRYCRGAKGKENRKYVGLEAPITPPPIVLPPIPPGLAHFEDWKPYVVEGATQTLIISDLHVPYHDPEAIELALAEAEKRGVDCIIINGDLMDFFSVSFWENDPKKRDFKNELDTGKALLAHIRARFPHAIIIFKEGNHEFRYPRYLMQRAPVLLNVPDFTIEKLMALHEFGVIYVADKRPIMLGKLPIMHGHEFSFGITSPVNPARGFYMRAKCTIMAGHLHRTSEHVERSLKDEVIVAWSTGCLCNLHPDYSPINNWNLGFAIVEVAPTGDFQVSNFKIMNGVVYG